MSSNYVYSTIYKIKVMQAFVDGRTILFRKKNSVDEWIPANCYEEVLEWNWIEYDYKVSPSDMEGIHKKTYINIIPNQIPLAATNQH